MLLYTAWTLVELEKRSIEEGLEAEHWLDYMSRELAMPEDDRRTIRDLVLVHRAIRDAREGQA